MIRYDIRYKRFFIDILDLSDNRTLDFNVIFNNNNPIDLEICSGNGHFLTQLADKNPNINYLGVELKTKIIEKCIKKVLNFKQINKTKNINITDTFSREYKSDYNKNITKNNISNNDYNMNNIFFLRGNIELFFYYFKKDTFNNIYINFPDPWEKKRYKKKRLINMFFFNNILNILKKDGNLFFVSDHEEYFFYYLNTIKKIKGFENKFNEYKNKLDWYPKSKFEILWRTQNKKIYYSKFQKKC